MDRFSSRFSVHYFVALVVVTAVFSSSLCHTTAYKRYEYARAFDIIKIINYMIYCFALHIDFGLDLDGRMLECDASWFQPRFVC